MQKRVQACLRMLCTNNVYRSYIYIYKQGLALNNLQWLICHTTKSNKSGGTYIGAGTQVIVDCPYMACFLFHIIIICIT